MLPRAASLFLVWRETVVSVSVGCETSVSVLFLGRGGRERNLGGTWWAKCWLKTKLSW